MKNIFISFSFLETVRLSVCSEEVSLKMIRISGDTSKVSIVVFFKVVVWTHLVFIHAVHTVCISFVIENEVDKFIMLSHLRQIYVGTKIYLYVDNK